MHNSPLASATIGLAGGVGGTTIIPSCSIRYRNAQYCVQGLLFHATAMESVQAIVGTRRVRPIVLFTTTQTRIAVEFDMNILTT